MSTIADPFNTLCWAVFLIVWIVAAFWTKPTAERHRSPTGLWVLVAVAAYLLLAQAGLHILPGRILWQYTPALAAIGNSMTLGGLVIVIWARTTLGGNWSSQVALKEGHELVEAGPYRYVRHPIYSGILLMGSGTVVLMGRTLFVVGFAIVAAVLVMKLRQEERLLTRHFGEAYERYKTRVKALVPFVL